MTTTEMALDAAAILQGSTPGSATPICSGTFITDRWVLTARTCDVTSHGTFFVGSYTDPNGFTTVHSIESVVHPSGTSATDWIDANGAFADFTLVKIVGTHPHRNARPTLGWTYLGNGLPGYIVGSGQHQLDGNNEVGQLRTAPETTYQQNGSGSFLTTDSWVGAFGDAGGPFYVGPLEESSFVLGVFHAPYYFNGTMRDRFTSIPFHLELILQTIGWTWPGSPPQSNRKSVGTYVMTISQSHLGCQYAAKHGLFAAYNHNASTKACQLYSSKTGSSESPGWTTGTP